MDNFSLDSINDSGSVLIDFDNNPTIKLRKIEQKINILDPKLENKIKIAIKDIACKFTHKNTFKY